MIQIDNLSDCCGCTACASICPHDAIEMVPDALGFKYPMVNLENCTNCGLCNQVCAFNDGYDKLLNVTPQLYGVRHKDIKEVETSRSGAAFIVFSDYILERGGVVYGAGYKKHFVVTHKRAVTKSERNEFKGSKYVQSDINDVFRAIKQDLQDGLIVGFSGTPCQTSGLNSYIGKKYRANLYLFDIVCHGVPSPNIWTDYIKYVETKYGKEIVSLSFRNKKKYGWDAHCESFVLTDGRQYDSVLYRDMYFKHIMFREACGVCHFCNTERPSDITLADFWGWEKTDPNMNVDNKGISLVIVNTLKGRQIFDAVKGRVFVWDAKLENVMQSRMQTPSPLHPQREAFVDDYTKRGFVYVLNKYIRPSMKYRIVNKIRSVYFKIFSDVR